MTDVKKIGIWQTAFLGDAVLTLPLIRALNLRYPEAEVHLWVRAGVESIFQAQTGIAAVHSFAKRGSEKSLSSAMRLGRAISGMQFDLWISAHTSMRSALVSFFTGIPVRIGYDSPWYNRMAYTRTVPRRFDELEEVERLMQLALPLGITGPAPRTSLTLGASALQDAELFWLQKLGGHKVLGVHPGSTWPTKCWPEGHFSRVVEQAAHEGAHVLVFAGPGEEDVAERVIAGADTAGAKGRVVNLAGVLSLQQLAAYIGRLDAYLTNDSGPMHLAWVQDVPLVALFGPTVKRLGFFPRGEHSTVMEADLSCRPCGLHGHKKCPEGHHRCMTDISPESVWSALRTRMGM